MKITLSPSLITISSANLIFLYSTLKGEYNPFPFGCSIFTSGFFTVISVPDFVISVDLFSTFGVSAAGVAVSVAGVTVVVIASGAVTAGVAGAGAGVLTTGVASAAGVLASGVAVVVFSAVVEVSDAVSAAVVAASVAGVSVVAVASGAVTAGVAGAGAGASWSANATPPSAIDANTAVVNKVYFLNFIIKPLQKNKNRTLKKK